MQCQTLSRPTAPGMAVTVLLGAHSQSDVAWRRMTGLVYFDRRLPVAGREDWPDGSGFMLVNMTMNAASVYVPLRGRAPLRTAAPRVQPFYCSWWQSLIMCSTKQEPVLQRDGCSVVRTGNETRSPFSLDAIWLGRFNSTSAKRKIKI